MNTRYSGFVFQMVFVLMVFACENAQAKLNVVTTVTDLRSVVAEVGGSDVSVESIAKGTQDPHFIEAKPSYMVKINRSDLLVSIGLELEIGWLPSLIQGARNPKVAPGQKGYLEVGPLVEPLEVPSGKITRAEGDVHPLGNPHVTLDPIRMGEIAVKIADRLADLDPDHASAFKNRAKSFQERMQNKTKDWQKRIEKSGVKQVVSYHKTLTYFFDRFKIGNPMILEPKPGIPPTSGHVLEVIQAIRSQRIPLVMVENFFDPTVTEKIKHEVSTLRSATVPVAVDGAPGMNTLDDLYEMLIRTVEGK